MLEAAMDRTTNYGLYNKADTLILLQCLGALPVSRLTQRIVSFVSLGRSLDATVCIKVMHALECSRLTHMLTSCASGIVQGLDAINDPGACPSTTHR